MSSDIAIRAEGIGKRYRIGATQGVSRYRSLREDISTLATRTRRRRLESAARKDFWALSDVSFDVVVGETVGIVGLNGAGKSTLLKVLSRITPPTSGRAEVRGRVGSLLEVGTGFHPELTGRENTFLNGAILGMRRSEILARFDEIIAFAEVEKFVDTPVKRYSSGMYLRLAFSVAAHLEPEILIVDEVLAVGDAEFQRKCFNKMQEIGRDQRTVLFVSHNLSAVRNICDRALLLDRGELVDDGAVDQVIDQYLAQPDTSGHDESVETDGYIVNRVAVRSQDAPVIKTFDSVEVTVTVTAKTRIGDPGLYLGILTLDNQRVSGLDFKDFATAPPMDPGQAMQFVFNIAQLPLLPGAYRIELHTKDMATQMIELVPRLFPFDVVETPIYGGRKMDRWFGSLGLDVDARVRTGEDT